MVNADPGGVGLLEQKGIAGHGGILADGSPFNNSTDGEFERG